MIDESKIKCNICKDNNKSKSYKKQFYKCNSCKFNLCPLCKSAHDKSHNIIDYDLYNYLCETDNEIFISYCADCNKNICSLCAEEHTNKNHCINNFKIPKKEDKINLLNDLRKKINDLNQNIKGIINELNYFMEYMENYYSICDSYINNYNIKNRNYENTENFNNIICNDIINDINKIINDKNIGNKLNKIIDINNKIKNINSNDILVIENQIINAKCIKLSKQIDQNNIGYILRYLEKNNRIGIGKDQSLELYDLDLNLINRYITDNLVVYIYELMDKKILLVENNNNIKILNYENNILSLYTNIETKEDKNFVGIEISNKFIICGGYQYLSIIGNSNPFGYELKQTIDLKGSISNVVELDSYSFLVGQGDNKKIIIFSNDTIKQIYEINNINFESDNYGIAKIADEYIGICGKENEKACLYILSIKKRIICTKYYINDLNTFEMIVKLNNNYFLTTGKGFLNDLVLLNYEIDSDKIIIKHVCNYKRAFPNTILSLISINNYVFTTDNSSLKIWEID